MSKYANCSSVKRHHLRPIAEDRAMPPFPFQEFVSRFRKRARLYLRKVSKEIELHSFDPENFYSGVLTVLKKKAPVNQNDRSHKRNNKIILIFSIPEKRKPP